MEKKIKKTNTLIKRKNLILEMKMQGIKRINPNSLILIEKQLNEYLNNLIKILKEEIIIKGRKTLKKEDIKEAIEKMKKEENFEI